MKLKATQPLAPRISLAKAGEGRTTLVQSNSPRYIHHRADGGFVVFDYGPVRTVSVANQNGVLE